MSNLLVNIANYGGNNIFAIDLLEVIKRNTQTPVLIVQTLDDINVDVAAFHQLSQE